MPTPAKPDRGGLDRLLYIALLIAVVPNFVLGYLYYRSTVKQTENAVETNLSIEAETNARDLAGHLAAAHRNLTNLTALKIFAVALKYQRFEGLQAFFDSVILSDDNMAGMLFTDDAGRLVAHNTVDGEGASLEAPQDRWERLLETIVYKNELQTIGIAGGEQPLIILKAPIRDAGQEIKGHLIGVYKNAFAQHMLQDTEKKFKMLDELAAEHVVWIAGGAGGMSLLSSSLAKPAMAAVLTDADEALLDGPIVFTGVSLSESEVPGLALHRDLITGVFEQYPIESSLHLLRDLTRNEVKEIAILTSDTDSSDAIIRQIKTYFAKSYKGVAIQKIHTLGRWRDWQKAVAEINKEADALWMLLPFLVKGEGGQSVDLRKMGAWLHGHIKVPSLSIVDLSLHGGAMASISVRPEDLGEATAKLIAAHAVDGTSIGAIPLVTFDRAEIMINLDQTDQVGIEVPIEILEYATVIRPSASEASDANPR